jgi:octaprenyl-diphosphate synthase
MFCKGGNKVIILDEFQKMFDEIVVPFINELRIEDEFLKPVFYTLRQKSNKFRSATALISAKICMGDYKDVLPIATVAELIHSSLIVQDDIADNNIVRRGKESAWKRYGICYALHSSVYAIPVCLKILSALKPLYTNQIKDRFLEEYQYVCKSQVDQSILELSTDMSYEQFLDIHMGKTAIGRWAIAVPALLYGNKEQVEVFDKFARKLGDAGSIKNDIEDFLKDDEHESFCSDIRIGRLTYPVYYYFSKCNLQEQKKFLAVFGRNRAIDYLEIRQRIIDKGTVLYAIGKVNGLVAEAIDALKDIPPSREKQLLVAWANNHNYL